MTRAAIQKKIEICIFGRYKCIQCNSKELATTSFQSGDAPEVHHVHFSGDTPSTLKMQVSLVILLNSKLYC